MTGKIKLSSSIISISHRYLWNILIYISPLSSLLPLSLLDDLIFIVQSLPEPHTSPVGGPSTLLAGELSTLFQQLLLSLEFLCLK